MVEADSDQLDAIVATADSYVGKVGYNKTGHFQTENGVLTQIDCSGLVSQALAGIAYSSQSFTQASTTFTTSQTASLFSADSSFRVGDIIWFPGHVGIVKSVDASGKVTSFIGSQTSTGPAVVDLSDPKKTYWQGRMSSAKAYKPCVPAPVSAGGGGDNGGVEIAQGGTGYNPWDLLSLMWGYGGGGYSRSDGYVVYSDISYDFDQ